VVECHVANVVVVGSNPITRSMSIKNIDRKRRGIERRIHNYERCIEIANAYLETASAGGKFAGNIAADFIPGAGLLKSAGEFLWDIISNRRQRINFADMNERATQHKEALAAAGIDPQQVFQLHDSTAKLLSDEAIYKIMDETLKKLDAAAKYQYKPLMRSPNVVELVTLNTLRPHMQSILGLAPKAIPVQK
jgi:hypothetical protein